MKITIDLNDESFSDYFEEHDGTIDFTSMTKKELREDGSGAF